MIRDQQGNPRAMALLGIPYLDSGSNLELGRHTCEIRQGNELQRRGNLTILAAKNHWAMHHRPQAALSRNFTFGGVLCGNTRPLTHHS